MIGYRQSLAWATGGVFLAASAVLVAGETKPFSHKKHLEEGVSCTDCHKAGEKLESACTDCHEEGPPSWRLPVESRRLRIRFPHRQHAESIGCEKCHANTASDAGAGREPLMNQEQCTACHRDGGVEIAEASCIACHRSDPRKTPPADHAHSWLERHGGEGSWRVFERHGEDCTLCHRSDACQTCHKTQRPRSHTGLWRVRTHGISASWNRESCSTCHETGGCIHCHRNNPPLNHQGAWATVHGLAAGTEGNERCAVCHNRSWCAACHAGGHR